MERLNFYKTVTGPSSAPVNYTSMWVNTNNAFMSSDQNGTEVSVGAIIPINTQNGVNYILTGLDGGAMIEMTNGSPNSVSVPLNSSVPFAIGTQILIVQYSTGQTQVVPDPGVTINSSGGKDKTFSQFSAITLVKRGTDEWYLFGDLSA